MTDTWQAKATEDPVESAAVLQDTLDTARAYLASKPTTDVRVELLPLSDGVYPAHLPRDGFKVYWGSGDTLRGTVTLGTADDRPVRMEVTRDPGTDVGTCFEFSATNALRMEHIRVAYARTQSSRIEGQLLDIGTMADGSDVIRVQPWEGVPRLEPAFLARAESLIFLDLIDDVPEAETEDVYLHDTGVLPVYVDGDAYMVPLPAGTMAAHAHRIRDGVNVRMGIYGRPALYAGRIPHVELHDLQLFDVPGSISNIIMGRSLEMHRCGVGTEQPRGLLASSADGWHFRDPRIGSDTMLVSLHECGTLRGLGDDFINVRGTTFDRRELSGSDVFLAPVGSNSAGSEHVPTLPAELVSFDQHQQRTHTILSAERTSDRSRIKVTLDGAAAGVLPWCAYRYAETIQIHVSACDVKSRARFFNQGICGDVHTLLEGNSARSTAAAVMTGGDLKNFSELAPSTGRMDVVGNTFTRCNTSLAKRNGVLLSWARFPDGSLAQQTMHHAIHSVENTFDNCGAYIADVPNVASFVSAENTYRGQEVEAIRSTDYIPCEQLDAPLVIGDADWKPGEETQRAHEYSRSRFGRTAWPDELLDLTSALEAGSFEDADRLMEALILTDDFWLERYQDAQLRAADSLEIGTRRLEVQRAVLGVTVDTGRLLNVARGLTGWLRRTSPQRSTPNEWR